MRRGMSANPDPSTVAPLSFPLTGIREKRHERKCARSGDHELPAS
jgi:hypothetical protein